MTPCPRTTRGQSVGCQLNNGWVSPRPLLPLPRARKLARCRELIGMAPADRRSFNDWDDPAHHGKLKAAHGNITRALSHRQAAINQPENRSTPVTRIGAEGRAERHSGVYPEVSQWGRTCSNYFDLASVVAIQVPAKSATKPVTKFGIIDSPKCWMANRLAAIGFTVIGRSGSRP